MLKTQAYWHFRVAAAFSLLLALITGIFLSTYGKNASFLIINKFNSPEFDFFFHYYTYLGDGMICIPLLLYVYLFKKEFFFPVIAAFLICALLTQFSKGVVFAGEPRPILVLKQQVRAVPGVEVHTTGSFPSGHTSMAFTYALLLAFLVRRKFWTIFLPIIAFFVGYSRVYLAQHFVTDVLAGIVVAMTSSFLALLMYERFKREKKEPAYPVETP